MAHIHYKFSSKLSYDTVVFDGPNISLTDLKKQIMGREKLRAGDCDLQIINAQTKEEFKEDGGHISKGSSVIVRRIPIIGVKPSSNSKTIHKERLDVQIPKAFGSHRAIGESSSTRALSFFSKMQLANLAEADVSEEDKIRVMMNQSSCEMMKMNSKLGPALPENYACYRCGNGGHHIRNCPVSGDKNFEAPPRIKKSTGIPRSFMVEVNDPNIKGVMLTSCGRYAIPAIDAEAYAVGKKEKPPFIPQEQPKCEEKEEPIPDELLCLICHDLLTDAVLIPCCGNSYCDDCIRTALLESETHVCPTCGQSDVSPDTLIANKFLRQAVNNFKKERGCSKSQRTACVTSQSQNTTPKPSPVPTLTPSTIQKKIKKPLQSPSTEQESLVNKPKPEKSPPLSQSTDGRPATPEPAPVENSSENASPQAEQSLAVTSNNEELEKTCDDEAITSSGLVSNKDSPDAPSQLIPQVNFVEETEQIQTICVNQRQSSSDSTTRLSGSSTSRDSTCSAATYPAGSLTESSSEQHRTSSSSSSYSSLQTTPPPLFPSPPFHTFVPTHQPLSSYLPGFPPTTPTWKLPIPPGAPLSSLCASSSTSSIPVLIPKEWYRFQRKKKERSPHKRSFSHSVSKSSKSKSSRSYSGSSSRSGSRSRSRSRHRSPYASHRAFHSHSNPSRSFGYKRPRSPTPSSSSSPLSSSHSRSKSSSDCSQKNHHHSKKSASSSHGSKKRGERSSREARKSSGPKGLNDKSGLELERQCYLKWKKEYQEWYDKFFSNYISQFHQLPFPPPPPPPPLYSQDSFYLKQEGNTVRKDNGSPTSEDSNYSRSPLSNSSNDCHSPICHPSSDSCSSPKANDDHSSPSHSSNDRPPTPTGVQVQSKDNIKEGTEKDSSLPDSLTKSSEEVNWQEMITDDNLQIRKKVGHCRPLKHEPKKKKQEKSPSSDSSGSINVLRHDKRRHNTEPHSCKDGSPAQHKGTASDSLKSAQPLLKPRQPSDKGKKEKAKKETNLETRQGSRKDNGSNSCQNRERKRKTKPGTDSNRLDTEEHQHPEGSKTSDSKSERDKKRKKHEERNNKQGDLPCKTKSSECLKPKVAEEPKSFESESLKPTDRRTQSPEKKKESEASPLAKKDIWEGGIKVISQKKISININLDGKKKDEKTEQSSSGLRISTELAGVIEEEVTKENTKTEVNEKKESSPGLKSQEKLLSLLQEIRESENKATSSVDKEAVSMKIPRQEKKDGEEKKREEEEDLDLWHCALEGVENTEEKTTGKEEEAEREKDGCREHKMVLTRVEKGSSGRGNRVEAQKEDKAVRSSSQRHKTTNIYRQTDTSKHSSRGTEGSQETTAGGKLLEDKSNDHPKLTQNQPMQVPHSKWEKNEKDVTTMEVKPTLPHPSEMRTNTESVEDNEQKRSTERGRDRNRVTVGGRGQQKERNSASAGSYASVSPSCGSERERDKERTRENERQRESERSKQGVRGEERRRDWDAPMSKRNGSSSYSSSHLSVSKDTEWRDLPRERELSSSCYSRKSSRSTYMPDQNLAKRHRDASLDFNSKNKDHFYDYSYHHQAADYGYKDRPPGTQHSPPAYSHCRDRSTHSFEPPAGSQRGFTNWELMQNKSRNESRVQKGERPGKEKKTVGDGNRERETPELVGDGGGWSRREEKAQRLEERRRSSSSSSSSVRSSASRRSSRDE